MYEFRIEACKALEAVHNSSNNTVYIYPTNSLSESHLHLRLISIIQFTQLPSRTNQYFPESFTTKSAPNSIKSN